LAELTKRVEILAEQNAWLKQRFFGRSSEALSLEEQRQLKLFDEAETCRGRSPTARKGQPNLIRIAEHGAAAAQAETAAAGPPASRSDHRHSRRAEALRAAALSWCASNEESKRKKLDVIPAQLRVIRTIRPMYAANVCERLWG